MTLTIRDRDKFSVFCVIEHLLFHPRLREFSSLEEISEKESSTNLNFTKTRSLDLGWMEAEVPILVPMPLLFHACVQSFILSSSSSQFIWSVHVPSFSISQTHSLPLVHFLLFQLLLQLIGFIYKSFFRFYLFTHSHICSLFRYSFADADFLHSSCVNSARHFDRIWDDDYEHGLL